MTTYTKKYLSASTDGMAVVVAATASPGTLLHAGSNNDAVTQEVWLYLSNYDSVPHNVTVQVGAVNASNSINVVVMPYQGLLAVVAGLILKGNSSTVRNVRAYADSASKVAAYGFINEIA